jgi:hypothetical protein
MRETILSITRCQDDLELGKCRLIFIMSVTHSDVICKQFYHSVFLGLLKRYLHRKRRVCLSIGAKRRDVGVTGRRKKERLWPGNGPKSHSSNDKKNLYSFTMAQQPFVGQGLINIEVSRSHSDTQRSVGLFWTSNQPDLENSDNTQLSEQTEIHAPCGIRTRSPSKRTAAEPRFRPRGHWGRRRIIQLYIFQSSVCLRLRLRSTSEVPIFLGWQVITTTLWPIGDNLWVYQNTKTKEYINNVITNSFASCVLRSVDFLYHCFCTVRLKICQTNKAT